MLFMALLAVFFGAICSLGKPLGNTPQADLVASSPTTSMSPNEVNFPGISLMKPQGEPIHRANEAVMPSFLRSSPDSMITIAGSPYQVLVDGLDMRVELKAREADANVVVTTTVIVPAPTHATAASDADIPATTRTVKQYEQMVLDSHNILRRNHSASDLTWSDDMASRAGIQAMTCVFAHDMHIRGGRYGQNILADADLLRDLLGVFPDYIDAGIINTFYNGEFAYYAPLFGQDNPDQTYFENWAHLTQILWADTTQVGCYTSYCKEMKDSKGQILQGMWPWNTVCNYFPQGNVFPLFRNVSAPEGHPATTVSPVAPTPT
ncbi:MAG: hypothetical protein Q9227_004554 [Pyrenula ochraceoflavens]